jgi:hypothetical protein
LFLAEDLQTELVFGVRTCLDRFPQITAMEVGIGAGNLDGFVPHQRMGTRLRTPMKLHELGFAAGVDEAIGVNAEPLHRPIAARNRTIGHRPHEHVGDLRHQRREIPERIVRGRRLWHGEVWFRLSGMHQVGELHGVLDEEHRDVVADEIPVALIGVELHRESANIASRVGRAPLAEDRREAHKDRRLLAYLREERRPRDIRERLGALEETVGRRPARVDDALGNALVVEVRDLFAEDEVLEQRRTAKTDLE